MGENRISVLTIDALDCRSVAFVLFKCNRSTSRVGTIPMIILSIYPKITCAFATVGTVMAVARSAAVYNAPLSTIARMTCVYQSLGPATNVVVLRTCLAVDLC